MAIEAEHKYNYWLEMWFRNGTADDFRDRFAENRENYYPHITLVRPFGPKESEEEVKTLIVDACKGQPPIPFCLEGMGSFGEEIKYIPVTEGEELSAFADKLEESIESKVDLVQKIEDERHLHLTIQMARDSESFPKTTFYMLRLTAMRNKKVWFSYDFVTGEVLNREETLDKDRWKRTVELFNHINHEQ